MTYMNVAIAEADLVDSLVDDSTRSQLIHFIAALDSRVAEVSFTIDLCKELVENLLSDVSKEEQKEFRDDLFKGG